MRVAITRLFALLRYLLIDNDLIIFLAAILLTGYVSLVLSRDQTIRPFHPPDTTLWYRFTSDTFPTSSVFFFNYVILIPLIYVLSPFPSLRFALGMPSATMLAVLVVELGKGYVGRLRPNFAYACLEAPATPDFTAIHTIFSNTQCPTANKNLLQDARRSFPSGHAALAVCGAAYFQLCLNRALSRFTGLQRIVLYALGWGVMALAAWVAASRVVDNAHHVADVATGALIGMWAACVHFWYVVAAVPRESTKDGVKAM